MNLETLAELAPWDWPEETGQVLLNALRDDGRALSERMIAVELAGNLVVVNDGLVAELLVIVGDALEPADLRARAAIRDAYTSTDEDWKLTAVFAMGFVRGFDDEILESLGSENDEVEFQAILAARDWALDAAWSHVAGIVASGNPDKEILLAAIEAVASIRPVEAGEVLVELIDGDDEDIVEAVHEAMSIAELSLLAETADEDDEFLF